MYRYVVLMILHNLLKNNFWQHSIFGLFYATPRKLSPLGVSLFDHLTPHPFSKFKMGAQNGGRYRQVQ